MSTLAKTLLFIIQEGPVSFMDLWEQIPYEQSFDEMQAREEGIVIAPLARFFEALTRFLEALLEASSKILHLDCKSEPHVTVSSAPGFPWWWIRFGSRYVALEMQEGRPSVLFWGEHERTW